VSEAFLFSFLVNSIQRGPHRQSITATVTQALSNWGTLSDLNFYALVMMLREFLLRDQALSGATLTTAYEAIRPYYVWPTPFCNTARDLLQYLDFRRKAPAALNCLEYLSNHPELLLRSKQEEFIHVIINEESQYGQATKELLSYQHPPSSSHGLKARFLQFFYKSYFDQEAEIWNFALMDQIVVNNLFNKAVDIVIKIASA